MATSPSTIVKLLNVPLQSDNKNQIDFSSVAAQTAYFNSKVLRSLTNFTYQRKDNIIRVGVHADLLYNVNYVMYDNVNYNNKWFYAFVEKVEYINDSCTHLHIKTDVWQTWQFDLIFKPSFIVREHVADDTPFLHTLPENVFTGDCKCYNEHKATYFNLNCRNLSEFESNYLCAIVTNELLDSWAGVPSTGLTISGNAKCGYYYACELSDLNFVISQITQDGQIDQILAIYPVLRNAINLQVVSGTVGTPIYVFSDNYQESIKNFYISRERMLNGLTVKNKKCLCFPYNYVVLHNSNGSKVTLKLENFMNIKLDGEDNFTLENFYSCSINPTLTVAPKLYNRTSTGEMDSNNFENAIEYNNFPQIAYTYDIFKDYCARNANALEFTKFEQKANLVKNAFGFASDIYSNAESSGSSQSLLSNVMSQQQYFAQMQDRANEGTATHGQPSGNMEMWSGSAGIYLAYYALDAEDLEIVDNYFTMNGYNVSRIKNVDFKNRHNHNFIQTLNIDLTGNVNQSDLQEIKAMFNTGVTFWHNPATFGDYTQNNDPV